jgi:hypothetical protein
MDAVRHRLKTVCPGGLEADSLWPHLAQDPRQRPSAKELISHPLCAGASPTAQVHPARLPFESISAITRVRRLLVSPEHHGPGTQCCVLFARLRCCP